MPVTRSISVAMILLTAPVSGLFAQNQGQSSLEAQIRKLDKAEAEGLLHRDTVALRKIWAPDFTVNNPRNSITRGSDEVIGLIRKGTIDYSSFVRDIESILFHGNAVIVMGSETIKPVNKAPFAGQRVRRRFTHFWMMRDGHGV
jgi:hypothetical protein